VLKSSQHPTATVATLMPKPSAASKGKCLRTEGRSGVVGAGAALVSAPAAGVAVMLTTVSAASCGSNKVC
jgi:hypothetical protein